MRAINPPYSQPTQNVLNTISKINIVPIPLQKPAILKTNKWFVLQRPSTQTGFLVMDNKSCLFIIRKQNKFNVLQLDLPFYRAGIFTAHQQQNNHFAIEDTIEWNGVTVIGKETFENRLSYAQELIKNPMFVIAAWKPLNTIQPSGAWYLQENNLSNKKSQ